MKLKKLDDNFLLFTFHTQKDAVLTFFRVQEYYESPHDELNGKYFSEYDFLDACIDKHGRIDYFETFNGFNVPGESFVSWYEAVLEYGRFSPRERKLYTEVFDNVDKSNKFYVIGAMEKDKHTIKHEIAHALYYFNDEYKVEADLITERFRSEFKKSHAKIEKELLKMYYSEFVLMDEVQAYLSSERRSFIKEAFNLTDWQITEISKYTNQYKKLLHTYNNYET